MKKHLFILITFSLVYCLAIAQVVEPVKWRTDFEAIGNNEFILTFNTKVDAGWAIYAQDLEEGGPIPTAFDFTQNPNVKLIGKVTEIGKAKEGFDPIFEMNVKKYYNKVTFKAKVKTSKPSVDLEVPVLYMSCNDEACVRLEDFFEFTLVNKAVKLTSPPNPAVVDKKTIPPPTRPAISQPKEVTPPPPAKTITIDKKESTSSPNQAQVESNKKIKAAKEILAKKVEDKKEEAEATTIKEEKEEAKTAAVAPIKKPKKRGILAPVTWKYEREVIENDEYLLKFTAVLEEGWYIYAQDLPAGGPIPTSFKFVSAKDVKFLDKTLTEVSEHKKEGFDPIFEMDVTKYSKEVSFQQRVKLSSPDTEVRGSLRYMTCDNQRCLPPQVEEFTIANPDKIEEGSTNLPINGGEVVIDELNFFPECGQSTSDQEEEGQTPWTIFFLGFIGGLAALLTPCVFPMIPLTVSFFTKSSKTKKKGLQNAFIYAISIVVIYVSLGFLVTVLFGPATLNKLSTNPYFNLAFFAIFVIFAISFFGYFEITLPSGLVNKVSSAEDKGGLIGIFFMAFTLSLVSFSCTGPIIGTLLVEAAVGGKQLGPILGMTGFAVALAFPFALFAAFPGWLNSLPRSGGWLNTVKVVLGFIELIFALKFLSNADLVQQWGLLKRETFLVIWIILSVGLGAYLFGLIKFPHDSPIKKLSVQRSILGVVSILFAIYLIPGMFCKSLPLVSGFPPPIFYSFNCAEDNHGGLAEEDSKDTHIMNLNDGMAMAKKTGKPVLIDFTGWACVNCRKMEENVWPHVDNLLKNYTIVSLYVDEDIALPKEEQTTYESNGKKKRLKTVGDKWSFLQTKCFGINTQPYYVLVNKDGELLNKPVGYTKDVKEYAAFLQEGLDNHENIQSYSSN